jgi:hypothetical protein
VHLWLFQEESELLTGMKECPIFPMNEWASLLEVSFTHLHQSALMKFQTFSRIGEDEASFLRQQSSM